MGSKASADEVLSALARMDLDQRKFALRLIRERFCARCGLDGGARGVQDGGLALLAASFGAGWLWDRYGAVAPFAAGGGLAAFSLIVVPRWLIVHPGTPNTSQL